MEIEGHLGVGELPVTEVPIVTHINGERHVLGMALVQEDGSFSAAIDWTTEENQNIVKAVEGPLSISLETSPEEQFRHWVLRNH